MFFPQILCSSFADVSVSCIVIHTRQLVYTYITHTHTHTRSQELQLLQFSNREKLSTINQSVESLEVQAALEMNPDISKERSNLLQGVCVSVCEFCATVCHYVYTTGQMSVCIILAPHDIPHTCRSRRQDAAIIYGVCVCVCVWHDCISLLKGWSSVSEALTQQISAMKARAEMMGGVEGALVRVCGCVCELCGEVEKPLPPSPELEANHDDIMERQVSKERVKLFYQLVFCIAHIIGSIE